MSAQTLPAFARYRPKPGHPDWVELAAEARERAEALLPRLEAPRRGPREWRRRARTYASALDNYRVNRRLHRAGREDLRPLYFIWTLLRACNFRCTYCDDHQGRRYPDLPNDGVLDTEQAERLLEVMRTRCAGVYFAGGEPILRKDLPALTRHARDLEYYPIILNTNASVLHRLLEKDAWRGVLADLDIVVVSLDALDLDLLGSMWAYRRPRDVVLNLLLLRELSQAMRFKLMVNTVIQPGCIDEARDVLDLADDLGVWFCPVPVNDVAAISTDLRDQGAYATLCDTILERKRQGRRITGSLRLNERLLRSAPLTCRNALKPHVDFDGRLVWPCKSTRNVAPAYVDVLAHDHVDDLYAAASRRVDPTGFHGPGSAQCGGSCNWAQNYSTDAYVHGLEDPLAILREVFGFLRRG